MSPNRLARQSIDVACRPWRTVARAALLAGSLMPAMGWCQPGDADADGVAVEAGFTGASVYALQPVPAGAIPAALPFDAALRIMVGTRSLPLTFSLIQRESEWGAWADAPVGPVVPPGALARGLPAPAMAEPTMRLWLPMQDLGNPRLRFTHAYVNLSRPTFQDGDLQVRPGAGVVMQLGSGTNYLQQLSLGSVFKLNMGDGSLALRLRGGRMGVQYRMQFNL